MLAPGSSLGPYTITAELGHGGIGVVYTAHDPPLKRQFSVRLFKFGFSGSDTSLLLPRFDTI